MDLIRDRCASCGHKALIEKIVFRSPAIVVRRCEHDGNRWTTFNGPSDVIFAGALGVLIIGAIVAAVT